MQTIALMHGVIKQNADCLQLQEFPRFATGKLILKWRGCLIGSLWLIFKILDTLSLTHLHSRIVVKIVYTIYINLIQYILTCNLFINAAKALPELWFR